MAQNPLEGCPVIERLPDAKTSVDHLLYLFCLVDLYQQTRVRKKTVTTINLLLDQKLGQKANNIIFKA